MLMGGFGVSRLGLWVQPNEQNTETELTWIQVTVELFISKYCEDSVGLIVVAS